MIAATAWSDVFLILGTQAIVAVVIIVWIALR